MTTIYQDFLNDLKNSQTTPLLIEVQKKHIKEMAKEKENFSLRNACEKLYNDHLNAKTNIIEIDAKLGVESQLLSELMSCLKPYFDSQLTSEKWANLAIGSAMIGASLSTGGLAGGLLGLTGTAGLDEDSVTEKIRSFAANFLDGKIENESTKITETKINSANKELHLSQAGIDSIPKILKRVNQHQTPHQMLELSLELINSISIGDESGPAQKLIIIDNPYYLDSSSFSILSLLFSNAKDNQLNNKHILLNKNNGIKSNTSVLFNYTEQQPYDRHEEALEGQHILLADLRQFIQRYGMLEKPSSTMPTLAIKSTTFVGRKDELESLANSHHKFIEQIQSEDNNQKHQWTLIQGEPGTGKTALAKKHIEQTSDNTDSLANSQIRLKLLNQKGHNSNVIGLASIEQSIKSELIRLLDYCPLVETASQRIFNKVKKTTNSLSLQTDKIKSYQNDKNEAIECIKNATKSVIDLLGTANLVGFSPIPGLSTVTKGAEAWYHEKKLNDNIKKSSQALHNENNVDSKQLQFTRITHALENLQAVSMLVDSKAELLPVFIFIDDLQWLDENSAEYIITQLLPRFPIQLLITARASDSITSYKKAIDEAKYFPYKLAFFNKIKIAQPVENDLIANSLISEAAKNNLNDIHISQSLRVQGMDYNTISKLIKLSFDKTSSEQAHIISKKIIRHLSDDDFEETKNVVTLFAIETLNLISDDAFYTRENSLISHQQLAPLFSRTSKKNIYLNCTSDQSLEKKLEKIFSALKATYHNSYTPCKLQNEMNQYFTLSSFAVMEERLLIIHQYFSPKIGKEYGDAAVFSLQLSALLGVPFDSDLIKYLIEQLTTIDIKLYPELENLTKYLRQQTGQSLSPEHLEVLDEAFEILRRIQPKDNLHSYHHSLFKLFFDQSLQQTLRTHLTGGLKDKCNRALIFFIDNHINRWVSSKRLDAINKKKKNYSSIKEYQQENFKLEKYRLISKACIYEFMLDFDSQSWVNTYLLQLDNLAEFYDETGHYLDRFYVLEQKSQFIEKLYSKNELWKDECLTILNEIDSELGFHEVTKNFMPKLDILKYLLRIRKSISNITASELDVYAETLQEIGSYFKKQNLFSQAIPYFSEALEVNLKINKLKPQDNEWFDSIEPLEKCLKETQMFTQLLNLYFIAEQRAQKNNNQEQFSDLSISTIIIVDELKQFDSVDSIARQHYSELREITGSNWPKVNLAWLLGVWGNSYHDRGLKNKAKEKLSEMYELIQDYRLTNFELFCDLLFQYGFEVE